MASKSERYLDYLVSKYVFNNATFWNKDAYLDAISANDLSSNVMMLKFDYKRVSYPAFFDGEFAFPVLPYSIDFRHAVFLLKKINEDYPNRWQWTGNGLCIVNDAWAVENTPERALAVAAVKAYNPRLIIPHWEIDEELPLLELRQ